MIIDSLASRLLPPSWEAYSQFHMCQTSAPGRDETLKLGEMVGVMVIVMFL